MTGTMNGRDQEEGGGSGGWEDKHVIELQGRSAGLLELCEASGQGDLPADRPLNVVYQLHPNPTPSLGYEPMEWALTCYRSQDN